MSNPKYTPMQILRDNIKLKIERLKNTKSLSIFMQAASCQEILDMIEGDSLGKPLLDQEIDCLEEAYHAGLDTPDSVKLESYVEATFTILPIIKKEP
jgi:hypothetical protein